MSKTASRSRNVEKRIDEMILKLRDHDFRITPQRMAVLRFLAASDVHPSVEMVYESVRREFPTTSLATIYKTINVLKKINSVLEISFPDGSNRYDGNRPASHPHIICVRCKKIMDLDLENLDEIKREVASETKFKILNHRLDFFGICSSCMADEV